MMSSLVSNVALLMSLSVSLLAAAQAQSGLTFRLMMPTAIKAFEPVTVRFRIENASDADVRAQLGWNQVGALTFKIIKPDGSVVTVRATSPPLGGMSKPSEVVIDKGTNYEGWIVLTELVDLSAPGTYALSVSSDAVIRSRQSGAILPTARAWDTTILVTETTLDEITVLCDRLAQEAMNRRSSFDAGLRASVALASVRHVAAVAYLEAVARHERWAWIVVPALERLPGPEAARSLEGLAQLGGDAGVLAKRALQQRRDGKG